MTSMPASRNARAMIFAPRSWPSRPGFAITTRMVRAMARRSLETTRTIALLDPALPQPRAHPERERNEDRESEQRRGHEEPDRPQRALRLRRFEPRRQRLQRLSPCRLRGEHVLRHHRVDEPAPVPRELQVDGVRDRTLLRSPARVH